MPAARMVATECLPVLMVSLLICACDSLLPNLTLAEKSTDSVNDSSRQENPAGTDTGSETESATQSSTESNSDTATVSDTLVGGGTDTMVFTDTSTSATTDTGLDTRTDESPSSDSATAIDSTVSTASETDFETEVAKWSSGVECVSDSDCISDHCDHGVCCEAGFCCNAAHPCAASIACNPVTFVCAPGCVLDGNDDNALCVPGYHCDAASCYADVSEGQCDENSDCQSGTCVEDKCCEQAGLCCARDADCPELFDGCAVDGTQTCVYSIVTLPITGQVECWSATYNEVACSAISEVQEMYGQDGHYSAVSKTFSRMDDTVVDDQTGLVWSAAPSATVTFEGAANWCDSLEIGGSVNWRLPTRTELLRLQIYSPSADTGISDVFDIPPASTVFWSSTPLAGASSATKWVVNFLDGTVIRAGVDTSTPAALCVRED